MSEWCQPNRAVPENGLQALVDRAHDGTIPELTGRRGSVPIGAPDGVGSLGQLEPAAVSKIAYVQGVAAGERVIGAQDRPDGVGAQHVGAYSGVLERCPGESNIDEACPQTRGRVGEVSFADAHVDIGVTPAEAAARRVPTCSALSARMPMIMVALPAAAATRARVCSAWSSSDRASS